MTGAPPPVVDFHAHFVPEAVSADAGRPADAPFVFGLTGDGYREGPAERLPEMDAMGVDIQVVSSAPPYSRYDLPPADAVSYFRDLNDELISWNQRWPERYLGFAALPLQDPQAAIEELERTRGSGMVGAIVGTHVNGRNWDAPELSEIVRAAESLDALLFFHPIHRRVSDGVLDDYHLVNLIGNPLETTIAIASLIFGGVLDEAPRSRLLFAHTGGYAPFAAGRFDHGFAVRPEARRLIDRKPSEYLRQMYVDCITHDSRALKFALDTVGRENVVLGTDFPADMGLTRPLEWLADAHVLSDEDRLAVLRTNAAALLPDAALQPASLRSAS